VAGGSRRAVLLAQLTATGLTMTQRIRARRLQHVPIVALTAGVMDSEREWSAP
jgi:CheY-like chemotaxis protein